MRRSRAPVLGFELVDRVYKAGIPQLREKLAHLKEEFSGLDSGTDWAKLRIEPLLRHAERLEGLLNQPDFAREYSRLRRGVVMFHSDLVYLRDNVRALEKTLESEKKRKK
ncbi:MAG: hypothetical protein JRM85_04820 [Nitrososphaerota archaeon]|nr:hypothetical protein [Nitrososphaerota archaeon]